MFRPLLSDYSVAIIKLLQMNPSFEPLDLSLGPLSQLLGKMEKVMGDLAYIYLRNCPKKQIDHTLSLRQPQNTQIMDRFRQSRVFSVQ